MLIKSFVERPSAADVRAAIERLRDDYRPAYEAGVETGPVPREDENERTAPTLHLRPHVD